MVLSTLVLCCLSLPQTVVWAWERPEDLSFVDAQTIGVAYLAATVRLENGDAVETLPRLQPLAVTERTILLPVIRIESPVERRPSLSEQQRRALIDAIGAVVPLASADSLQIDFDARLSERAFYRSLLVDLREELPPSSFLSMTALASWCLEDRWLDDLPIDEAVPMLFRMGDASESIRSKIDAGDDFAAPQCRSSAGVSTDEPIPSLPRGRRYYVFHPGKWNREAFESAAAVVEASQR